MPMLGSSNEPWPFACSFNLASCRQRAETLARQFHSNFWSPRSSFSSDGGSRCVSPSFGFISPVALQPLVIVERPAITKSLKDQRRTSSLDDDDEDDEDAFCLDQTSSRSSDGEVVVSPPEAVGIMSPPKSPQQMTSGDTQIASLPVNGEDFSVKYRRNDRNWMPDSPPESLGSESLPPESPIGPLDTEDHSITPISSNETASEISSPTAEDFYTQKSSELAHELCSRLKQFENLQVNGGSAFTSQTEYIAIDMDDTICSEADNDESKAESSRSEDDSGFLLSPEPCPRLIRSTSLKTGKTPPDTPNRKKYVRFADALGLDLEAVRHFIEDDDVPLVPQSAFADLKIAPSSSSSGLSLPWVPLPGQSVTNCQFLPLFKQPAADPYFLDRVRQQKVCLENLMVNDLRITAVVRVLNLGYQKQVVARYTSTEWASYADFDADYVPQSCDGFSDKFTFTLHLPHLCTGQKLAIALKYIANGQIFWDNNTGKNYILRVQAKPSETDTSPIPRWSHHFM